MKRKRTLIILCTSVLMALTACGKEEKEKDTRSTQATQTSQATQSAGNGTESREPDYTGKRSAQIDVDPVKLVTSLCDYKKISVPLTGNYEVTEEKVKEQVQAALDSLGLTAVETDKDTVEKGDYVNVDYTGYLDGEAFEGGSAKGVLLDVENNRDVNSGTGFIEGFSSGLIGAKKGTTVSSKVKFPDNYDQKLAGKETTFEFKINGIYRRMTVEEITDAQVAEKLGKDYGLKSVKDVENYMRNNLKNSAENGKFNEIAAFVEQYLLENCTVEVPEDYLMARLDEYQYTVQKNVENETQTLEEYFSKNSESLENVREGWKTGLLDQIKTEFIYQAIAAKENIKLEDEGYQSFIQSILSSGQAGVSDEKGIYNLVGNGFETDGKVHMQNQYVINKALEFVIENADAQEKKN